MKQAACFLALAFLCATGAQGAAGAGFVMDTPAGWTGPVEQELAGWHGYSWYRETGETLVVNRTDNADGVNLYDWGDDASAEVRDLDQQELIDSVTEELTAEGLDGVDIRDVWVALGAMPGGEPCMEMTLTMFVEAEDGPWTFYANGVNVYSRDHQFVVECVAADPETAQALLEETLPGFAITEETFDGPTPRPPLWERLTKSLLSADDWSGQLLAARRAGCGGRSAIAGKRPGTRPRTTPICRRRTCETAAFSGTPLRGPAFPNMTGNFPAAMLY